MAFLVAVDLTDPHAPVVVRGAAEWAVLARTTLDVAYVENASVDSWFSDDAVRRVVEAEHAERRREDAEKLSGLLSLVPESARGSARVLEGEPVEALVTASASYGALVVATHGRRGFAHFWMGSIAEQVVRGAQCPVIVLRTASSGT
jgi:nucleotide-binding universal stress UspA family protein